MKDSSGKKIHILSPKDAAAEALLRGTPATMMDLRPLQQQLLNVGGVLHTIANMLEGFEAQFGDITKRVEDLEAVLGTRKPYSPVTGDTPAIEVAKQ